MSIVPQGYYFERIAKERLCDLIPLYKGAFNQDVGLKELIDKYDTEYVGVSYIGYIAYTVNGDPAAYYGVFPMKMEINGRICLISQSGDTMTHPSHQGKGLFVNLAKHTYELCISMGILAVFGFPSASSYPGFTKKLDWIHHENILKFTLWTPTFPLGELSRYFHFIRSIHQRWAKLVLGLISSQTIFPGSVLTHQQNGVNRSKDFFEYKLRNPSVVNLQWKQTNFIVKISTFLGVGDIQFPNERFEESLRILKIFAFFAGLNRIVFYVSPDSYLAKKLQTKTKGVSGLAIGYRNFSPSIDLKDVSYTYVDFDTF